jgi:predicted ATPase
LITIKFLKDYRFFNKNQIIKLDDSKAIIFVGDNGSGKSTLIYLIYIASIMERLKANNEEIGFFNLTDEEQALLGTDRYHLFTNFNKICEVTFDKPYECALFTPYDFDLGKDLDLRNNPSACDVALSIQLRELSKGESYLNQFFNFIEKTNAEISKEKKHIMMIFDEPDCGLAIKHCLVFSKYLNEDYPLIVSLHNAITIKEYSQVYWIKPTFDEFDKRNGTDISIISGKEYVDSMILEGYEIIKRELEDKR